MPERRSPVISRPAKADLLNIWSYIAAYDESAADKVLRRIDERIATMPDFPHAARFEVGFNAHILTISPYLVAYTVADDTIEILRVVHGRRDLNAIFP